MSKVIPKHNLLDMSLHSRLLVYFIIVSILPILLMGYISYTVSFNVNKEKTVEFSMQMINQTANEINELLLDAYKISEMIANDPLIQETLRKPLEEDISKRYSIDLMIDSRLNFISSYRKNSLFFSVVGANGGKYKSSYFSFRNKDLTRSAWYVEAMESSSAAWFSTHTDSFALETIGQSFVSLGLPIIDKASGRKTGVVLIDIEEDMLFNSIRKARLGKTGYMFILDKNNNIISHSSEELGLNNIPEVDMLPEEMNEDNWVVLKDQTNNKAIVTYKPSMLTGWKFVGVVPVEELVRDSKIIRTTIFAILLFICIIAVFAAWNVAGSIARPIKKLMTLMKKAEEGDLSVVMNVKYEDEIGQLGRSFNVMIQNIKSLMNEVYEEQRKLRKAELKALQAQINPHFLYNTLDSVIWMARANRNEEVAEMVTAVTKLFRIGISRGKDIISIREELEHIKSYLTIQNIRYKNKFSYEINVSEDLYQFKIVKLVLQPIVENAIYHGIKLKREKGYITINGREEENSIILEVCDTGIGMTKNQLDALRRAIGINNQSNSEAKDENYDKMESYGVKNVDERIKIFFGPDNGLTFHSQYGVGTRVEVRIPKTLEVEENVKSSVGG